MTASRKEPATRILLVDDDSGMLRTLQLLLEDEGGFAVETATSGVAALDVLTTRSGIQLVLSDLSMPGMDGIELLSRTREVRPGLPVMLMTAYGTVQSAVEAMKAGAFQYLTKPVDPDELLLQVERALDHGRLAVAHRQLLRRTGDPDAFDSMVGSSPQVQSVRQLIDRLADVDSTALIRGETGTGKELAARLIHRLSTRSNRPFVVVNCTAIPGDLIESELFGHERGAFTGATAARPGRMEEAEGGTLLLDEIGDMPPNLQPKLLRFLQERTVQRVGGRRERRVDVRVLAATHRDLEEAMAEGSFRPDLFHRLNTIPVRIPPLREHAEDLAELCEHLLAKISRRLGRSPATISNQALSVLSAQGFPGNVRELENILERAMVLYPQTTGDTTGLQPSDLLLDTGSPLPRAETSVPLANGMVHLAEAFDRAEADLIQRALDAWPGEPHSRIAERLGTTRRVLEARIAKLGGDTGGVDQGSGD